MSRQLITTVYTFDELTTEAKNRAIEDYRQDQDFPWLSDDMSNKLVELLAENKITYDFQPNLYFSLSYSQGDGAMFEGTMRFKAWTISVKHYGNYYHENSKTIESITSTKTGEEPSDKVWKRVFDEFEPLYVSICKQVAEYGYSIIEAETSDENISQWLLEMDVEFNADGLRI